MADVQWRTIIALSRLGGLRAPSEVMRLKWEHVDLVGGEMKIAGKGSNGVFR
jgi:integrase